MAQQLDIAIAIGENYFTRHQFYDIIKAGCADIIQPDNRRAGGVTEWLDIGSICDVAGLRLASHGGGRAMSTCCTRWKRNLHRKRQPEGATRASACIR